MSILSHLLLNIGANFRRLLPAQPCLLCGSYSRDGVCCKACTAELPLLTSSHCPVCALPSPGNAVCGECLRHPPPFEHTVAAFSYAFPIDKLIQALKFREHLLVADYLADALAAHIDTRPDCIVALPLHPLRLRERGFNQSQLLAQRLACRLDIPVLPDVCSRVRNTPPQVSLPWKERDKNMHDAFHCQTHPLISGRHVAIVDDVMTTGASTGALATALKQAGAAEVSIWVVARTLPHAH